MDATAGTIPARTGEEVLSIQIKILKGGCKNYVKTHECFAKGIDCNEFYFSNVDIEDEANFLTLYDRDGTLAFKCRVTDIERFAKMQD